MKRLYCSEFLAFAPRLFFFFFGFFCCVKYYEWKPIYPHCTHDNTIVGAAVVYLSLLVVSLLKLSSYEYIHKHTVLSKLCVVWLFWQCICLNAFYCLVVTFALTYSLSRSLKEKLLWIQAHRPSLQHRETLHLQFFSYVAVCLYLTNYKRRLVLIRFSYADNNKYWAWIGKSKARFIECRHVWYVTWSMTRMNVYAYVCLYFYECKWLPLLCSIYIFGRYTYTHVFWVGIFI